MPFMDLMAHLIMVKTGGSLLNNQVDLSNFNMTLYASFSSQETAIGLDLAIALHKLCSQDKQPMFRAFFRFTKSN